MIKVLFICLGNVCRSPLAEAIFNHKVEKNGLQEKIQSDSCGTSDYHIGEFPDERSLACAKNRGILINHRGRQINRRDLKDFDYLIVMDQTNLVNVQNLLDQNSLYHQHLYLMREFQENPSHSDIPDPYYGDSAGFETVFDILEESLDNLLAKIKKEHPFNV